MPHFVNHFTPRALHFATLSSLIYTIPVAYAITSNLSLLADYTVLLALFFGVHFLLYLVWYTHPKADLGGNKVQLLFYHGLTFLIVIATAFCAGIMHPNSLTADGFFFGYVALPTLYTTFAVFNYGLFVWSLKIL